MEHKNLAYRELAGGEIFPMGNCLDLYVPEGVKDFPVVFLVHGGAWAWGDKTWDYIPEVAKCLVSQGIGVVAPNYRLSPLVQHPRHVRDLALALAWTLEHIGEYGGQTGGVVLMGHSAGGHLVSLLATDTRYLEEAGIAPGVIWGVITLSGVYQVSDVTLQMILKNTKMNQELGWLFNPFPLVFGMDMEVVRGASPLAHVRAGLPPFLVMHAESDLPTLGGMAEAFHAALVAQKCPAEFQMIRERNHCTVLWNAKTVEDPVVTAVCGFVQKHGRA